jgi:hypothetical protein
MHHHTRLVSQHLLFFSCESALSSHANFYQLTNYYLHYFHWVTGHRSSLYTSNNVTSTKFPW